MAHPVKFHPVPNGDHIGEHNVSRSSLPSSSLSFSTQTHSSPPSLATQPSSSTSTTSSIRSSSLSFSSQSHNSPPSLATQTSSSASLASTTASSLAPPWELPHDRKACGSPATGVSMDAQWLKWLSSPPPLVLSLSQRFQAHADDMARNYLQKERDSKRKFPRDLDVVVCGSGFKVLYFLGVMTVLDSLVRQAGLNLHRFSGCSSGAQAPFQILLTSLEATLNCHLAYGMLCSRYTPKAGFLRGGINVSTRQWPILLDYLMNSFGQRLHLLDDRMFVSVSVFSWSGLKHIQVSKFSGNEQQTREAFHATGAVVAKYQGSWATDGGLAEPLPIFQPDTNGSPRHQLVVEPLRVTELPLSMVCTYQLERAVQAVRLGQDACYQFFKDYTENPACFGDKTRDRIYLLPPRESLL
eukprot:gb/GEZN01009367.1/.p1 GENE.gb/GEZN01009367.1/~~gb/GEZN01009367.1/.p1  ORF type:complete len:422 (-),score=48.19 gb/GEZN01009367.1/:67-1299(-)